MKHFLTGLLQLIIVVTAGLTHTVYAEEAPDRNQIAVSGYVRDAASGELLIGASVAVRPTGGGTLTNAYGYFSLKLPAGHHTLGFSYLGYGMTTLDLILLKDTLLNIELNPLDLMIGEVVVRGENFNDNLLKPQMSVTRLDIRNIRQIPAFMGEVDVIDQSHSAAAWRPGYLRRGIRIQRPRWQSRPEPDPPG